MAKAKVLSLKQLKSKKFNYLEDLPENIVEVFGQLTNNFTMTVYGDSSNGKSNLIIQLLKILMPYGEALYISYEEGHEASMAIMADRQFQEAEHSGRIRFADGQMDIEELRKRLRRKRSEQFIVIDSIQYWRIRWEDFVQLKLEFANKKSFIFISHARGRKPKGNLAEAILYDSTIKVRVEGFVADVRSRLKLDGNPVPYVIWEDGAKRVWGKNWKDPFNKKKK